MTDFTGYPPEAFALLRELPDFTRDDYQARKKEITSSLLDPTKAFVDDLVGPLREVFGPDIDGAAKVNGSISPLNNDLRFAAPDTPMYRDYVMVTVWDGASKKTAPKLHVRLMADEVGFGIGMGFTPEQLARWRDAVADDRTGPALEDAIAATVTLAKGRADVWGSALKTVPKPFDRDHPRGDLLKHKAIQVRWPEPLPKSATSSAFVDFCVGRLERGLDLHRLLVAHVA